jgi:hypothetical protein
MGILAETMGGRHNDGHPSASSLGPRARSVPDYSQVSKSLSSLGDEAECDSYSSARS